MCESHILGSEWSVPCNHSHLSSWRVAPLRLASRASPRASRDWEPWCAASVSSSGCSKPSGRRRGRSGRSSAWMCRAVYTRPLKFASKASKHGSFQVSAKFNSPNKPKISQCFSPRSGHVLSMAVVVVCLGFHGNFRSRFVSVSLFFWCGQGYRSIHFLVWGRGHFVY